MEKIYDPKSIEQPIYDFWETLGCFEPCLLNKNQKQNYCIMMPPPNITGGLHLGHAFQQTIMDILIRYNRMKGKNTLWATGFDHAGIATQILIENYIYNKTGKTKNHYTRNFLLQHIWKWKEQSENLISYQMKKLGNSVSWNNKRFTMDPEMSFSVKEAFIRLYKDNLIYRRKRLVNWDYKLQTAISDLEVSYKKIPSSMWYIRYILKGMTSNIHSINNNNYLVIATTRPETIFGDIAIAVNPKDLRYHRFIGKYVLIPIINRSIPVISDKHIDIDKGTGCVKITPAHDFNDYIIGKRHDLCMINIFTTNRTILKIPEIFNSQGTKIFSNSSDYYIPKIFHNLHCEEARKKVIEECSKLNLLENIQTYDLNLPYNNRTGTIIEPILTDQWYIRTQNLAEHAIYTVTHDIIKFIPKKYKNIYLKWMYDIQDWCISRQIYWGHEIPAWYDDYHKKIYVGHSEQDIRINYQLNKNIILRKDNDVLDTWFSSSLWTLAGLGWPNNNNLLNIFHPTNVMVSGFDIIFFWIARMIMMTMYFLKDKHKNNQIPFQTVYITGLIRDEFGRKMSKSEGNIIDPLDIIDGISIENLLNKRIHAAQKSQSITNIIKYTKKQFPNGIKPHGADATRLTLIALTSSGRDIQWDMNRLIGYRNFCNKLWNASRFILINTINQNFKIHNTIEEKILSVADRWIITKLNLTIYSFCQSLEDYRFDKIANILYEFIWHQFCDWYIEFTKPILYQDHNKSKIRGTQHTLITSLEYLLRLAHPILPFITEKIWQEINHITKINNNTIMLQSFPVYDESMIDINAVKDIEWIQNIISEIRVIRIYMCISSNITLKIAFYHFSEHTKRRILENYYILTKLTQLHSIDFLEKIEISHTKFITITLDESKLLIFIPNAFNKENAINRFRKEIKSIDSKINILTQKINTQNNLNELHQSLLTKNQEKLNQFNTIKLKLIEQFSMLNKL